MFARFTDPVGLAGWFWPPRLDPAYDLDARPGGCFHVRSATAGFGVHGEYVEVSEPRRLVLTWQWDDADEWTRVAVDLTPSEGATDRTLVVVTHSDNATVAGRDEHGQGWRDCLERLATS